MADIQQLERAFLNAHKAGDTKAAGVLAAEIKRQRASKSSAPADAPVSGIMDQFWSGVDQPLEDMGVSVQEAGKALGSSGMASAGQKMRDATNKSDNFVSASGRFVNPQKGDSYVDPVLGFGWGNLGGAVAEQSGNLAGSIAARSAGGAAGGLVAGPGGAAVGAFAGPALFTFIQQVGPTALQRAQNDGRTEPTWEDWAAAAATAGASGALDAIGVGKLGILNQTVKEVGKKTATTIAKEAVKETGKKALKEGATEAGQSVVEQFGSTAGTKTGTKIDLKQAVGEGIIGAGTGGAVDAAVNAPSTVRTINDIRSVDSQMRNNPDAQLQAETTLDVNNIADRMSNSGKAPVAQEVNRYVSDIKKQINEAIDGQKLDPEDKKALKGGMQDATGLTQDRLDEIAGRSENPSEIKALARRIQVVREMTVQKPTAKGWRGWAAMGASLGGAPAGAAIGSAVGVGPVAGAAVGQTVGTSIARKLRGSQTQGNNIDKLVGKTQARRAQMLLDRYGPSDATLALNTLTEKAAANKAQAEAEAQAKTDFEETMSRIRYMNSMRQKSQRAMEQANTKEERAKAAAEKDQYTAASREERLKGLAYRSMINKARAERLVQDLEQKKTLNALTVEMTKTRQELQQKMAEAKADSMNRQAKFEADNLKGKLEALALDIAKRQEALKKAEIATKRAEKMAQKAPVSRARAAAVGKKYASMTAEEMAQAGIKNPVGRNEVKQMMDGERAKIEQGISETTDPEFRSLLRGLFRELESIKNNNADRKQAYEDYLDAAASLGPEYRNRMEDLFDRFATHQFKFEREGRKSQPNNSEQDPPF